MEVIGERRLNTVARHILPISKINEETKENCLKIAVSCSSKTEHFIISQICQGIVFGDKKIELFLLLEGKEEEKEEILRGIQDCAYEKVKRINIVKNLEEGVRFTDLMIVFASSFSSPSIVFSSLFSSSTYLFLFVNKQQKITFYENKCSSPLLFSNSLSTSLSNSLSTLSSPLNVYEAPFYVSESKPFLSAKKICSLLSPFFSF